MGQSNKNLPAVTAETVQPDELTKEYVMSQLVRLFSGLEDATGDAVTATLVVEKLAEGVEADPQLSKEILTPENIGKALELKKRADAGTLKLTDVTAAYPQLEQRFPLVSMLDKLPFKF